MTATPRVKISPRTLRWAREELSYDVAAAAAALNVAPKQIEAYEAGTEQPTLAQVRAAAKAFRRTPAFFFLAEPPPSPIGPADYRGKNHQSRPSKALAKQLHAARQRRDVQLDLYPEGRFKRPPTESAHWPIPKLAQWASEALEVDHHLVTGRRLADLNGWISAVEALNVLVFQMQRVEVGECRGFSVMDPDDDRWPIIMLNGADADPARTFTLLHELGHLLREQ